jgi:hypothetical protein
VLASSSPSRRDENLGDLGTPLASVLAAAAAIGAAGTRDTVLGYVRNQGDAVAALEISRIDAAELPVTHVTRRQGRPYTLVLKKTDELFAGEQEVRTRDEKDLEWLAEQWNPSA